MISSKIRKSRWLHNSVDVLNITRLVDLKEKIFMYKLHLSKTIMLEKKLCEEEVKSPEKSNLLSSSFLKASLGIFLKPAVEYWNLARTKKMLNLSWLREPDKVGGFPRSVLKRGWIIVLACQVLPATVFKFEEMEFWSTLAQIGAPVSFCSCCWGVDNTAGHG